jgi:mRNA interferase YafQ
MVYFISRTKKYEKSIKRLRRSGNFKEEELDFVIDILKNGQILDPTYSDHGLLGEYAGYRECHIRSDLLLMYKVEEDILLLVLFNIGSHSELF